MKHTMSFLAFLAICIASSTASADTHLWITTEGSGLEITSDGRLLSPPPPPGFYYDGVNHHHPHHGRHNHCKMCKKHLKKARKQMKHHRNNNAPTSHRSPQGKRHK